MATYPVILYPKLIADFRKTHSIDLESDGNQATIRICPVGKSLASETSSEIQSHSRLITAGASNSKRKKKLSIVLTVLGLGLVTIGVALAVNSLEGMFLLPGMLAFLFGVLTLTASLFVRCGNFKIPNLSSSILVAMQQLISVAKQHGITPNSSEIESVLKEQTQTLVPCYQNSKETNLKLYLFNLADTMRGKVLQPDGVTDAPVGASEKAFREFLERFFPGRVHTQLRLSIPNWDGAYSTDFTISFPEIGIWIDCEIDEPYDYKTGKPTHCINSDCNRNTFFLKNNWIVVRFSEEQVVRYPESCCKELATVIQIVTGMGMYSKKLVTFPALLPTPMWTHRQAKNMAKAMYRDRYLNSVKLKV